MTHSITILCYYAECHILFTIMLNVVMQNAVMLSVVMLNVAMLSVVMLNVVMLSVVFFALSLKLRQNKLNCRRGGEELLLNLNLKLTELKLLVEV
jgi:hypothetical protein